jgi:hydrogenase-4 component B
LLHSLALNSTVMIVLLFTLALLGLVGGLATFAMVKVFAISMLGLTRSKHVETRSEKSDWLMTLPVALLGAGVLMLGIFAKSIIGWLNSFAVELTTTTSHVSDLAISQLSSRVLFFTLVAFVALSYLLYKFFAKEKAVRVYKTWDCGQTIDESMEYTATAFAGPIRFFFIHLQLKNLILKSQPVCQTNQWIRKYAFSLSYKSIWSDKLYKSIAKTFQLFAGRVKVLQGGRIQYYLLFVLGTLIVTLIIVL